MCELLDVLEPFGGRLLVRKHANYCCQGCDDEHPPQVRAGTRKRGLHLC
jgi:hypothetical protein